MNPAPTETQPQRGSPLALTALIAGILAGSAWAQGTAFTYQGQLKDGGAPASGSYDLSFSLWDDPGAGNQVGATIDLPGSVVAGGLFTVELDFGPVFGGDPLWLEIAVNAEALSPRQSLTSTPYCQTSSYSQSANIANYAYGPWIPTGGDLYYADGNVGIGTSAPTAKLEIAGNPGVDGIRFPDGSLQTTAAIGGGGDSVWSLSGINAYYNAGHVGVGTSSPDGRLHVSGGPLWTASSWAKSVAIGDAGAIEFGYGATTTRFGIGASANNLYFFRTTSEGTGAAANYFMFANSAGNVGVNTLSPVAKMHVRNTGALTGGDAIIGETTSHRGVVGTASDLAGVAGQFTHSSGGVALKADGTLVIEQSGDGSELLRFNTERPWVFRQTSSGPSAGLELKSTVGLKEFYITAAGGTNVATFRANDADPQLIVNGRTTTRVLQITGADLAERFPTSGKTAEPGTVMEIDPDHPGSLRMARGAYNQRVAGVVSGANDFPAGAILGHLPGHEDAPAIALSGRVWVHCDATSDAIEPGDLLTTSAMAGHAMKAVDRDRSHGAVIGKAMTQLESGRCGLVLVLVNLQ